MLYLSFLFLLLLRCCCCCCVVVAALLMLYSSFLFLLRFCCCCCVAVAALLLLRCCVSVTALLLLLSTPSSTSIAPSTASSSVLIPLSCSSHDDEAFDMMPLIHDVSSGDGGVCVMGERYDCTMIFSLVWTNHSTPRQTDPKS